MALRVLEFVLSLRFELREAPFQEPHESGSLSNPQDSRQEAGLQYIRPDRQH